MSGLDVRAKVSLSGGIVYLGKGNSNSLKDIAESHKEIMGSSQNDISFKKGTSYTVCLKGQWGSIHSCAQRDLFRRLDVYKMEDFNNVCKLETMLNIVNLKRLFSN